MSLNQEEHGCPSFGCVRRCETLPPQVFFFKLNVVRVKADFMCQQKLPSQVVITLCDPKRPKRILKQFHIAMEFS